MTNLTEIYGKIIAKKVLKNPYYVPKYIGCGTLGLCPRKVILMFDSKLERRQDSEEKILNQQRMFRISKMIEHDHANIYRKKGILFAYNVWLTEWLPKGSAGQLDFLLRNKGLWEMIEFKAPHPNKVNFSDELPEKHHVLQAKAYVYALAQMGIVCDKYCVYYVPSGGQATPIQCWDDVDIKAITKEVKEAIFHLLKLRKAYREKGSIPPVLDRVLKLSKAPKSKAKNLPKNPATHDIKLVPTWECNPEYCPFSGFKCDPELSTNKVASIKEDGTIDVRKEYKKIAEKIEKFVKDETTLDGEEE